MLNCKKMAHIYLLKGSFLLFLVRHKVKELIEFVQDNDRLRQERKRAKQNREKYIGLSSDVVSDGFYSKQNILYISANSKCKNI